MKALRKRGMIGFLILMILGSSTGFCSGETASGSEDLPANDPLAARMWNFDYMDVWEAWDLIDRIRPKAQRKPEDRIKVAVLDTGAYYGHPDLQANLDMANCVDVAGKNPPYGQYEKPRAIHGTTTAAIIGATSNNGEGFAGVAAGSGNDLISLMAINVFPEIKYTGQKNASTEDVIKGLEYACEKGARVVCMCLGHSPEDKDAMGNPHDDDKLEKAINKAVYEKDVVVVCSAGNRGDSRIWYPSDFDATISVISTQRYTDPWSRESKSPKSSYGMKKNISAPGRKVLTARLSGAYRRASGTSIAAPSVAGVVALMLYVNPALTAEQVKNILYATATDLADPGYDIYTGYGNVNAYRAVAAAAGLERKGQADRLLSPGLQALSAGYISPKILWKRVSRAEGYYIYRFR